MYRLIRLKRGTPRFRVNYNPALNYARGEVGHKTGPEYVKTYAKANERDTIYLYSGIPYDVIFNQQEVLLQRDEFLLLSYNQKLIPIDMNRVNLEFQRTRLYWMNWTNRSKKYTAFNEQIERSMLVLKLMSYQRSGAVLAALTTSLPESIGEVRNWDYRFCWLRDASMSIETLVKVGHRGAAERFIAFITGILYSKYDRFQIMYGIRGERVLTEYDLPHLAGYKNSKPVRVGNDAYHQMQNDSFGYLMDVIYQYYLYFPGTLDEIEDMFEVVKNIVRTVMEDWRKPDKGIWEIRGDEKHFVLSKVMCWVALDRAIRLASKRSLPAPFERWNAARQAIHADIWDNFWDAERGHFVQYKGGTALDGSMLLMPLVRFVGATDPRWLATLQAIERTLVRDGMVYRYLNEEEGMDGLEGTEGAFAACSFWYVECLARAGQVEKAHLEFEQLLRYANPLGLYAEEFDCHARHLGNTPQALTHLALISAASFLDRKLDHQKTQWQP